MGDAIVDRGSSLTFQIRNDGDTAWELAGGIKEVGYVLDSPVEDITNSSTTTDFAEAQFTGFSQINISLTGIADSRNGVTDPATGLNIVGSARLLEVALGPNRCHKIRLFNVTTGGFLEGNFNITSFEKTGPTPGLLAFTATLQSASDITFVGDV